MNKRVVLLANDTTYTYNLRLALIKELINQKYEIYIVAEILKFKDELESIGCHLINIDIGRHGTNPLSDIKLMRQYKKILKKIKPAYVLSYNIKPNVYGGMACKNIKTKFMPNITGLGTALEYPGIMQKITIILNKIGLKKANVVFFQNSENMSFFQKNKILSKKTKMVLLPGSGVDLEKHKLMDYPNDKTIRFLFIARIMKDKGIDIYLETAKKIKEKYPNTEFHICGYCDDDKYNEILKLYEKDKIIIYHGEQKDMIPFFKIAHCIVHPSYYPEGMSNVLLEAAVHGRPIICTNRSGCRETVNDNETGYVVPIKNTEKVVECIEKIIKMSNKERKQMGLNGRRKIEKEFDRKIVVEKYIEEIEKNSNQSKTKVLHVFGKLQMGGAETMIMNIYKNIDRNKFDFDFIVHGDDIGGYEELVKSLGGRIYRIPKYKVFNHLEYVSAIKKIFSSHREYNIIHCHIRSTASIIMKIAKSYGFMTISHSHSTSNGTGIKSVIKKIYQKSICKYADYLFSCSKESAIWLFGEKNVNSDRCFIINNAIDSKKYIYNDSVRYKVRNSLKLNNDTIVLGQVGRIVEVKNYEFTIKLLKELININNNYHLVIVGSGPLKSKITNYINDLNLDDYVTILENRSDVNELLQGMDIFLMPSLWEGLPLSLVEAQASDLKCLISNNVSSGILDYNNVIQMSLDSIESWIKEIMSFSFYERKNRYQLIVDNNFDIDGNVRKIEELYTMIRGDK